jgi:hypothetical protein
MCDRLKELEPGVPFHLVVRIALETCGTAREAMQTIRSMPLFHSFSYFVADKDEMYLVESHPNLVQVTGGRADVLAVTNHYQHPGLQAFHGHRALAHSRARLSRLQRAPATWGTGADPLLSLQRLLSDHEAPICGHCDGAATLWSVVCDPAHRTVAYAQGAPCRNPYRQIPWPGEAWSAF